MKNNAGFTLVELLVTVLIIGILAAVAVTQYDKAVILVRASEIKTLVRAMAKAQDAYYMENEAYPDSFDELAIDVPLATYTGSDEIVARVAKTDVRAKEDRIVVFLNKRESDGWTASAGAYIGEGPLQHTGFMIVHNPATTNFPVGELLCVSTADGCAQLFDGTKIGVIDDFNVYTLPS